MSTAEFKGKGGFLFNLYRGGEPPGEDFTTGQSTPTHATKPNLTLVAEVVGSNNL
jgi:hypothetical protein